jgi:hypothetical protein
MLIGEFQLQVTPALPPSAGLLVIYRDTPKDLPLVDFVEGPLSEVALDTNARQAVFIAAEAQDEFASTNYQIAVDAASAAVASANQANIDAGTAASAASAAGSSALLAAGAATAAGDASAAASTSASLAATYVGSLGTTGGAANVGADDAASGSLFTTVQGFITRAMSSAGAAIVGFIQSGIGAIQRTVQNKLRDFVSVKDFGAVGDGVTFDLPAVLAAFAAHKCVEFQEGVYNLGDAAPEQTLIDLSSFGKGVSIITRGRVEFLVNMTDVGLANIFKLVNNSDFSCGVVHMRDTGYSNLSSPLRGVRGFILEGGSAGGWQGVNIEAIHAKNIVAPFYVTGGDASNRIRGINIGQIISDDCYYGYTSANNGDGVRIGQIIARLNYRPYFAYGCTDHDVKVLGLDNRQTSGAINISRSPGGLNTGSLRIKYTARNQSRDITHVLVNHIDTLGGDISDISVDFDIQSAGNYNPVRFVNYTGSGGSETSATSTNTVRDIRLSGTCDVNARPISAVASYANAGNLEVNSGNGVNLSSELFSKFNVFAQVKNSYFLPAWTTTGTSPSIGNGSLFGGYSLSDGLCHATVNLVGGTTTTWGTGQYSFSLPFTPKANAVGSFYIFDSGTAYYAGSVLAQSGTDQIVCYVNGAGGGVGAANPMPWANGDILRASVVFPVA